MNSFITFLRNYWILIVLFAISILIFGNSQAFLVMGTIIYVPVLGIGGVLLALAIRAIFHRDTTWPYVNDKDPSTGYDADFKALPPNQKVWLTAIQFWFLLGYIALIILASMG